MNFMLAAALALAAAPACAQQGMENTQRIQTEVRQSIQNQQAVDSALNNAEAGTDFDSSRPGAFDDDSDGYAHYIRLFAEPAFRLRGNNTAAGYGGEVGFLAAYDANQPAIGFSIGYFTADDKFDSSRNYKMVPIMVRLGGNIPITPNGALFSVWASGGYSINSYESDVDGVKSTLNDSYMLMGQAGFRFPLSKYVAVAIMGGYQYMKPEMQVTENGVTTSSWVDLGAPFVKLNLEF